jgi:hypothetical protein
MPPADRVVAITAVVLANHEPAKWFDGRSQVQIGRGQFVRSWGRLAREAGVTVSKARVSAGHLAACGFLSRRMIGRYSLYTLPKYQFYQDAGRYGSRREIPEGYVLLARKVMDSDLWRLPPGDRALAVTCLLLAHHSPEPAEWSDGSRHVDVGRGQFVMTWDKLASAANLGLDESRASMARLESTEFVVRSELGGPPVFTIPNYDFYQSLSNYQDGAQDDPHGGPLDDRREMDAEPGHEGQIVPADAAGPVKPPPDDSTVTRWSQVADNSVAGRSQVADNKQEGKKNEKKGEGDPPSPELFPREAWGAPPPLPPDARTVAGAYLAKFPGVMGEAKALRQASLYISRGGDAGEALRAIAAETRGRVVIWKILDPITDVRGSCLSRWSPPEEREGKA